MKYLILALSLAIYQSSLGQELVVVKANKAYLNDEKLSIGDTLDYQDEVLIKEKGLLELSGISSKHFTLKSGTHSIGDEHLRHLNRYRHHDSIYYKLQHLGIADCQFNYQYYCKPILGGSATFILDRIEFNLDTAVLESLGHEYLAEINPSTKNNLLISWTNPDSTYSGKYYILIEELFGDFLELQESESNQYNLNLKPYRYYPGPFLFITIIAENCRESTKKIISFKNQ